MAEAAMKAGLKTDRIEMIHMITNLIEGAEIKQIKDRTDASMLAVHIVDGIEEEAERRADAILKGALFPI